MTHDKYLFEKQGLTSALDYLHNIIMCSIIIIMNITKKNITCFPELSENGTLVKS